MKNKIIHAQDTFGHCQASPGLVNSITFTGMQLGTSEGNVFDGVAMMIE